MEHLIRIKRTYSIHGQALTVQVDSESLFSSIHDILGYFGFTDLKTPVSARHLSIEFSTKKEPFLVPDSALQVAQNQSVKAWKIGEKLYLSNGPSVVRLNPLLGTGTYTTKTAWWEADKRLPVDQVMLITLCILSLLRYRGFFSLHGAAVAQKKTGYLFLADSGSGKSTLALSLVRQGWNYLSDDSLLIKQNGSVVNVLPLRRDLLMLPDAICNFAEIAKNLQTNQLAHDQKKRLNMAKLFPNQLVSSCKPQVIVFPKIVSDQKSQFIPLSKSDAMRYLIELSGLVLLEPKMTPKHMDILKCLVNQAKAYQLLAGQDLKENPDLISTFLAKLK